MQSFTVQVLVEGDWLNYCHCRDFVRAVKLSVEELSGYPFRVLGFDGSRWVECLVRGSLLAVDDRNFRKLRF